MLTTAGAARSTISAYEARIPSARTIGACEDEAVCSLDEVCEFGKSWAFSPVPLQPTRTFAAANTARNFSNEGWKNLFINNALYFDFIASDTTLNLSSCTAKINTAKRKNDALFDAPLLQIDFKFYLPRTGATSPRKM